MKYKEDYEEFNPHLMKKTKNLPGPKKNEFVSQYTLEDNSEECNEAWRMEIYDKMAKVKWDIAADHDPYVA